MRTRRRPSCTLLLALLAAAPCRGGEVHRDVTEGVVLLPPEEFRGFREVVSILTLQDDRGHSRTFNVDPGRLAWHLDHAVALTPADVQVGMRVRIITEYGHSPDEHIGDRLIVRVEVLSLGPHALAAAVEDWVVEASGNRPDKALTPGELAIVAALGSASALVREATTEALRDRGIRALRPLIWARHSPDREVRTRAGLLLHRLGWSHPAPD